MNLSKPSRTIEKTQNLIFLYKKTKIKKEEKMSMKVFLKTSSQEEEKKARK